MPTTAPSKTGALAALLRRMHKLQHDVGFCPACGAPNGFRHLDSCEVKRARQLVAERGTAEDYVTAFLP